MSNREEGSSQIYVARSSDDVVVVRVVGRGTFDLSPRLTTVMEAFNTKKTSPRYIIDLAECTTLDSTFMGVIASLAVHQNYCGMDHTIVVNPRSVTHRQIETMGLQYLLDLRTKPPVEVATITGEGFERVEPTVQSRVEQLVHMIESHEALIDAHSGNEILFRPVLKSLQESLERAKENEASE